MINKKQNEKMLDVIEGVIRVTLKWKNYGDEGMWEIVDEKKMKMPLHFDTKEEALKFIEERSYLKLI